VDLTSETRRDGQPGKGGLTAITQPAIAAVESGRIQFVPDNWKTTYYHWLHNIQDWCISRQLWWGHRIPAWYDADGQVYVDRNEAEARSKYGIAAAVPLTQDNDVFDTWFSADIWPMATLGWPQQTAELKKYYPSSVLVTGFDIIFFWVARMVMMGQHFMDEVPFRQVYITGLVRDPEGNKMSKSKGNVLDPLDVVDGIALEELVAKRTTGLMKPEAAPKIEKKTRKDYPNGIAAVGVDALRFTFASLATQGRDIRFDAGRAEGYRNFCNKIWNASRFVLMNLGAIDEHGTELSPPSLDGEVQLSSADRWIISCLQRLEAEAAQHFASYRFDLLATALYQFIWNEYCDWYLELSKPALLNGSAEEQRGTRRTLVRVLEVWLRLLHPLMPFVTEEIWQKAAPLAGKQAEAGKPFTIMTQPYPVAVPERIDVEAEADIEWLKGFILGVRQIRAQMDISPGKVLPLLLQNASASDRSRIAAMSSSIGFLARVEPPRVLAEGDEAPESSTALLGEMKLLVPMAGLIDKAAELARLGKQIAKLESDVALNTGKLSNPNFGKAPEAVQQKTRDLIAQQTRDLEALKSQALRIEAL
jgi:valyl-tRNA synthetase